MANVTGSIKATTSFSQTLALPGTVTAATDTQSFNCNFGTSGTAADNCDLNYVATLALVASTPQVLDLKSLTDRYGNAVAFVKVRSITIKHKGTTSGQPLLFGYATTTANAWTGLLTNPGQITINPSSSANDGFFIMTSPNTAGWAVGASSKLLQLDPGSATFSVDIEISGTSA